MDWNWALQYWTLLASIATVVEAAVVTIAAIYAYIQLREAARNRQLQASTEMLQLLTNPEAKEARRNLYQLTSPPEELSEEDWKTVELVCNSFNRVGLLIKHRFLNEEIFLDFFAESILLSWQKAEPYVRYQRQQRWDRWQHKFEMLANQSQQYLQRRYPDFKPGPHIRFS